MAALAQGRNTPRKDGRLFGDPVAADTLIYEGALVCLDAAGNAVPGSTATTLKGRGVALRRADNTGGAAGAIRVEVDTSPARFANSAAGDAITRADIGAVAYVVDDQTVAKTAGVVEGSATRSAAGTIIDVDDVGVWIRF